MYIVSGSSDLTIRIWNLLCKRQEIVFQNHINIVTCIAITNDNKYIVSGSSDMTVRIWNFQAKIQEAVLQGHTDSVYSIVVTTDSK